MRGLSFYAETNDENGEMQEVITNLKHTDWTDAVVTSRGEGTTLAWADAIGAKFGFTESIADRQQRHKDSGDNPKENDMGYYWNFEGSSGNFEKTQWANINFGGGSKYNARFDHANLSEAVFIGCNLSGLNLSKTKIDNLKITDPVDLYGLIIKAEQIETLAQAIEFPDPADQKRFSADRKKMGAKAILENIFNVIIINEKRN